MFARAREEEGFGLVELLMAMTILSVGILAVVAGFSSGIVAIDRASRTSTATALADTRLELYRGITYCAIQLAQPLPADATYVGDPAYSASQVAPQMSTTACPSAPYPCIENACVASQTLQGGDGRNYRVDTYVVYDLPADAAGAPIGRELKRVTVVVRDVDRPSRTLAREVTAFDRSTGS